jgi:hypothetical protein
LVTRFFIFSEEGESVMKKLSFSLMLVFLVIGIKTELAQAVPDARGEYYGSYTTVVTSSSDSASNGTYNAVLEINIPTQSGNSFSGTATGTFNIDNSALIGGWFYNPGILAESHGGGLKCSQVYL